MSPIYLAVEDRLSEVVGQKLLFKHGFQKEFIATMGLTGNGWLRKSLKSLNTLAQSAAPVLVLTDLDMVECAPSLINKWFCALRLERADDFLFRVSVREIEAWLLADSGNFSAFCGCPMNQIPIDPESELDPKQRLLSLIRRYGHRELKADMLPYKGSSSVVGVGYNMRLIDFVCQSWDIESALERSDSLFRADRAISNYCRKDRQNRGQALSKPDTLKKK